VARVCEDGVLPVLVDARLRDPETAEAHDEVWGSTYKPFYPSSETVLPVE
jgi:hypothetical protein